MEGIKWVTVYKKFLNRFKVMPNGCWEWQLSKKSKKKDFKYGGIGLGKKKRMDAHRFSYLIYIGEIKNGMMVCHKCDNPPCVNPFHLFLGTHSDNMRDAYNKGRTIAMKHPSRSSYTKGCRCDGCKKIKSFFNKKARDLQKNQ